MDTLLQGVVLDRQAADGTADEVADPVLAARQPEAALRAFEHGAARRPELSWRAARGAFVTLAW